MENIPVFFYTFLACFSFCFIFKFHKLSHMIAAATGGMLSWVFYLAFSFLGSDLAQYLISTIVVSAYAEVMARVFKAPVTGFLTIGILPLVPGGGIYYTMEYCVSGQTSQFIETGIHTFAIAGALAVGVLIVSLLVHLFPKMQLRRRYHHWRKQQSWSAFGISDKKMVFPLLIFDIILSGKPKDLFQKAEKSKK